VHNIVSNDTLFDNGPTPGEFVLWHRPPGRRAGWQIAATAPSEREAWRLLGDDNRRGSGDYQVLPRGQEP